MELLSDRARADTSAPGSSSWLSNMEFSSNSMTDNSFDKDNPLKQVLQLCSTLAGKGCDFLISVMSVSDWKVVTTRWRRQSDRSLSPVPMIKHRFVVRRGNIEKEVLVNAPAHVAKADVAHAFQNPQLYNPELYNQSCYFRPELYDWERNIKYIPESQEYEFISNTKSFKHWIQTNNDIVVFHRLMK